MGTNDALWASSDARRLIAARDVGGLVRLARVVRGWRQADLGRATGYSASTISRIEGGRRSATDVRVLRRVAGAVGISDEVLGVVLGLVSPAPTTVIGTAGRGSEEDGPMRRRSLLTAAGLAVPLGLLATVDDALAALPSPSGPTGPADVAALLGRSRRHFDAGDYRRVVAGLPDLLATAHTALDTGRRDTDSVRLAACYDMATEVLSKVGRHQAGRITADRSRTYARLSGSPVAAARSARMLGIVLRHEGRHDTAQRLTLDAAATVEATGLETRAQMATYARTLCTGAYNAATAGDRHGALELVGEAERAASRLTAMPGAGSAAAVTPAAVTLYRVGVHWALGDAGTALHAGRTLHPGQFPTAERRARLHTDLARAWWRFGKPDQAARALLAAYREAPAEVRDRPAIRAIVGELAARHATVAGVPELARAVGARARA